MKKTLSVLLVLVLLLGVLPSTAFAEEAAGERLTRATLCQFIVDGLELEYDESMEIDFTDVPTTHPNYQAIAIMCCMGVIWGYSNIEFCPEDSISRRQAATFLYRLGLPDFTPPDMPSDVDSYYYHEGIAGVLGAGIMQTDDNGLFRPNDRVYSGEIDMQVLRSVILVNTTDPVRLDLSEGSVVISENVMGVTQITQGTTNIRTEDTDMVIRQSRIPTSNTISVESGDIVITLAGVNIKTTSGSAISVSNGASLTLSLAGENTADGGVYVPGADRNEPEAAELTIQGPGKLTAVGKENYAGIGSQYGTGRITINGGTITATGGSYGAGIGGGDGNIMINGGTVTATGGSCGAGIGGGDGNIMINGGTVTATGGGSMGGAGIGGGYHGAGGNITINGGTVTATGGGSWGGAGIGGGSHGAGGNITINGGTVTATGSGDGAGIGGGYEDAGGNITITGGDVTAHGNDCAIGGGGSSNRYGCDSITIEEENVTLTLSHNERYGYYDLHERVFDLELPATVASHAGNALGMSTKARSHSGIDRYQWQTCATNSSKDNDWTDVEGQTSAVCTAPMTAALDGHYFRCKIINVYGNVSYTDATQGFVLAFKNQPQSVETGLNETAALNATSTCSDVVYRWQRSYDEGETWTDVPGENYATLMVNTTRSENGALYRCVITAANGDELPSESARITVDTGEQTYTVRYYQENVNGSGYTVVSQEVLTGEAGQRVTAPEKSFAGFTENPSKGTASGIVTAQGQGLILSRYYDRNTYEIRFQMNGGPAVPAISGKYGAQVSAPVPPSRYGFQFAGWYADAELSQSYTFGTMPLDGAVVYARWTVQGEGRGIEYRVEGLAFRDVNTYETLDSIPSGDFLAEVTVTNLSSTETDTILLVTYDENGRMLDMGYLYANPQIGQTVTLGVRIHNSNGRAGKVKAFVLPALGSPVPLANAVERT